MVTLFVTHSQSESNSMRYGKSTSAQMIYPRCIVCIIACERKRERATHSWIQFLDNNSACVCICLLSPLSQCSICYVKLRRFGSYYSLINIIAFCEQEKMKKVKIIHVRFTHVSVASIINADSSYNLTFTYAQTHQIRKRNETRTSNWIERQYNVW